jgi:hypothetical protein
VIHHELLAAAPRIATHFAGAEARTPGAAGRAALAWIEAGRRPQT